MFVLSARSQGLHRHFHSFLRAKTFLKRPDRVGSMYLALLFLCLLVHRTVLGDVWTQTSPYLTPETWRQLFYDAKTQNYLIAAAPMGGFQGQYSNSRAPQFFTTRTPDVPSTWKKANVPEPLLPWCIGQPFNCQVKLFNFLFFLSFQAGVFC
jgi:hypothetical protein